MIKKHKYCAFSTKLYKTVSKKIERFGELIGHIANPALNKLSEAVANIDDKTVDKFVGKLKELDKGKGIFSVVK